MAYEGGGQEGEEVGGIWGSVLVFWHRLFSQISSLLVFSATASIFKVVDFLVKRFSVGFWLGLGGVRTHWDTMFDMKGAGSISQGRTFKKIHCARQFICAGRLVGVSLGILRVRRLHSVDRVFFLFQNNVAD